MAEETVVTTEAPAESTPSPAPAPEPEPTPAPAPPETPPSEPTEKPDAEDEGTFKRWMGGLKPDERTAVLQEYYEGLSPEEKAQMPWVQDRLQEQRRQMQGRREQEEREQRERRTSAYEERLRDGSRRLLGHLDEVLSKARDPQIDAETLKELKYDQQTILAAVGDMAQAQAGRLSQERIVALTDAIVDTIHQHGGPLTEDILSAWLDDKPDGPTLAGRYLEELVSRVDAEARQAERETLREENERWRKAELAAVRAEVLGELKIEKAPTRGGPAGPQRPRDEELLDPTTPVERLIELRRQKAASA